MLLVVGLGLLVAAPPLAGPLLAVSAATALGSVAISRRRAVVLRRAAFTDRLTGLYRYEYFADALPRELERVRRYDTELSLVVFDLDRFKEFNDRHGHAAGNLLLAGVGRALKRETRGTDLAARFGGEEFALVLPGTSGAAASKLLLRLKRIVSGLTVQHEQRLVMVTASFGMASHMDDERRFDTHEAFVKAADEALYAAKHAGRDRVGELGAGGEGYVFHQ